MSSGPRERNDSALTTQAMVEAAGIEPASENTATGLLRVYPVAKVSLPSFPTGIKPGN